MRGCEIKPNSDIDVVVLHHGSQIRNGCINVSGVSDYDSMAISFDATDSIGIWDPPPVINNMRLASAGGRGIGVIIDITGAESGYNYQMKALDMLKNSTVSFNIALVSLREDKQPFYESLRERELDTIMVEEEEITLYPQVRKRLEREGLIDYFK